MKRILLILMMIAGMTVAGTMPEAGAKSGEIINLVRSYNHEEGFEVMTVGSFGLGLVKLIAKAAAVSLLAGIGFNLMDNEPEDTFNDPREAYAELEKAFSTISGSVSRGIALNSTPRNTGPDPEFPSNKK